MPFADLLATAQRDPDSVDFQELRLAYAQSPDYAPYARDDESAAALQQAISQQDLPMIIATAERLLKANYLNIFAHLFTAIAYEKMGDQTKAAYHNKFGKRLVNSTLESGDGRSIQTAFTVITITEEYDLLKVLKIGSAGQTLLEHEGHYFDEFQFVHPETGASARIYFNIDHLITWFDHNKEIAIKEIKSSLKETAKRQPGKSSKHRWWQFRKQ